MAKLHAREAPGGDTRLGKLKGIFLDGSKGILLRFLMDSDDKLNGSLF
jgi:hypothetical protein